jgi:hypothetical protein
MTSTGRSSGLMAAALAMAALSGLAVTSTSTNASGNVTATVHGPGDVTFHGDKSQKNTNRAPIDQSILSQVLGGYGGRSRSQQRRAGYGWTNAHAKRVAAKKRRVKVHRRSRA